MSPQRKHVELPTVPRAGDLIHLGDGIQRHVTFVVWVLESDPSREEYAGDIRVEVKPGLP